MTEPPFWDRDKFADLPIIRNRPIPADDELQTERDVKHQAEVQQWLQWKGDDQ